MRRLGPAMPTRVGDRARVYLHGILQPDANVALLVYKQSLPKGETESERLGNQIADAVQHSMWSQVK